MSPDWHVDLLVQRGKEPVQPSLVAQAVARYWSPKDEPTFWFGDDRTPPEIIFKNSDGATSQLSDRYTQGR